MCRSQLGALTGDLFDKFGSENSINENFSRFGVISRCTKKSLMHIFLFCISWHCLKMSKKQWAQTIWTLPLSARSLCMLFCVRRFLLYICFFREFKLVTFKINLEARILSQKPFSFLDLSSFVLCERSLLLLFIFCCSWLRVMVSKHQGEYPMLLLPLI